MLHSCAVVGSRLGSPGRLHDGGARMMKRRDDATRWVKRREMAGIGSQSRPVLGIVTCRAIQGPHRSQRSWKSNKGQPENGRMLLGRSPMIHGLHNAKNDVKEARQTACHAVAALQPFLPSLMGGLSLGLLVVGQLVIAGKVLGISGAIKGIVEGDRAPWRVLFVTGLVLGGLVLKMYLYPDVFGAGVASLPLARIATAGVLVGMGTSLGNGCTSGHGICGNARLSARSFISTITFMLFGALAASILGTAQAEGVAPGLVVPEMPDEYIINLGKSVMLACIGFIGSVAALAHVFQKQGESAKDAEEAKRAVDRGFWLQNVAELGIGFLFALGLGVSGMTQPARVSGFLSILSGTFDPSLIFVMGGALLVAMPGYQIVLRSNILRHPLTCEAFSLPTSKEINLQLIGGSALFGAGWGLAGLCPGPGLVSLATFQGQNMAFVGSMVVGMALAKLYQRARASMVSKQGAV